MNVFIKTKREDNMPKIIENLKEQITKEAERQLFENGYAGTTVRSVAKGCNIATGTVYNYFESKDLLISAILLKDWHLCTDRMKRQDTGDSRAFLKGIYDALRDFMEKYDPLFRDQDAAKVYAGVFNERHRQLKQVLGKVIMPICGNCPDPVFFAEHIAETLLFGATENTAFEKMFMVFEKLLEVR